MAKARHKHNAKEPTRHLSPLVLLRPRLDGLLGNEALAEAGAPAFMADLNGVLRGLDPADFLPVVLKASQSAPAAVRERLDAVMPAWLQAGGYVDTLLGLLQRHRIEGEAGQRALTWLGAVGADLSVLQAQQVHAPFYQAHMYADDSQGVVSMFWYTDSRRRQVQGMSFLIDYHPPWEGAIKDVTVYPVHAPAWVTRTYLAFWADRLTPLRPLEAAEAKRRVLHGLEVNRREGIRLPSDLIAGRDLFLEHVPDLPDTADTPAFTAQDFEVLSHLARSPEELRVYEQTVGRRVRLPDGKELLVMGPPLDEDEW